MVESNSLELPCGSTDIERQNNFLINPPYLEVIEEIERFTGESPLEYVNETIKNEIKFILQNIDSGFPSYVEEICKKLDIDLWGVENHVNVLSVS